MPTAIRGLSGLDRSKSRPAFPCSQASGQKHDLDAERLQELPDPSGVLFREDLGGGHERGLAATLRGEEHREERDSSLPRPYIALEESAHPTTGLHVRVDLPERSGLCVGERERERLVEWANQLVRTRVTIPGSSSVARRRA